MPNAEATPARLFEHANAAAAEALRFARDPNGTALAKLRWADARALRNLARSLLK